VIEYPVTVPASESDDTVKTTVKYQLDGEDTINTIEINGNGGTSAFKVPEGSSGNAWFTYSDRVPKESTDSPKTRWENADDVTAPTMGNSPLTLGIGKKVD